MTIATVLPHLTPNYILLLDCTCSLPTFCFLTTLCSLITFYIPPYSLSTPCFLPIHFPRTVLSLLATYCLPYRWGLNWTLLPDSRELKVVREQSAIWEKGTGRGQSMVRSRLYPCLPDYTLLPYDTVLSGCTLFPVTLSSVPIMFYDCIQLPIILCCLPPSYS